MSELNASSVDPDQTPRSAASILGLYCLAVSLLWDPRLKRVKKNQAVSHTKYNYLGMGRRAVKSYTGSLLSCQRLVEVIQKPFLSKHDQK